MPRRVLPERLRRVRINTTISPEAHSRLMEISEGSGLPWSRILDKLILNATLKKK
jgi:hypothetical protein